MLKRQVDRFIDQRIGTALGPSGFRRVAQGVFRKAWSGGFDQVVVMLVNHQPRFRIDMSLDVRLDEVEVLATKFDLRGSPQHVAGSVTTMTKMGQLRSGRVPYVPFYDVSSEHDLSNAMVDFEAYMATNGLALFEMLHDEAYVERTFNEYPLVECVHCVNEVRRVVRGLVLVRRVRPEAFEDLVGFYRDSCVARFSAKDLKHVRDLVICLEPTSLALAGIDALLTRLRDDRRHVRHAKFGLGEVLRELDGGEKLEVRFSGEVESRVLLARFLTDEP